MIELITPRVYVLVCRYWRLCMLHRWFDVMGMKVFCKWFSHDGDASNIGNCHLTWFHIGFLLHTHLSLCCFSSLLPKILLICTFSFSLFVFAVFFLSFHRHLQMFQKLQEPGTISALFFFINSITKYQTNKIKRNNHAASKSKIEKKMKFNAHQLMKKTNE